VGYAGGHTSAPTYHQLGDHTETIEIDYDPRILSYEDLLDVFWTAHDPRRPAASVQYRSAIFYRTDEELTIAEASKARMEAVVGPVSTAIEPLTGFHRAEDYHQKYRLRSRRDLMAEFGAMYPDDRGFVDSTAAARVNGWLDGYGTPEDLAADLPRTGLSEGARDAVRGSTHG
jgi:peptide-methionine (S)-S-oxide reductase